MPRSVGMGAVLPVAMVAGIGLVAYAIYQKIIGVTPTSKAQDAADAKGVSDYETRNSSSADALSQLKTQVQKSAGLTVSPLHEGLANTLNSELDSAWVDHDKIVSQIADMAPATFQLTAIAYGQRELKNYRNSPAHLLEPSVWSDLFSDKKLYGTLKYHLTTVLTSSEQQKIADKLALIV